MKLAIPALALASAVLVSGVAVAHEETNFSGKVTSITDKAILVRTPQGRNVRIPTSANIQVFDHKRSIERKLLKTGQDVDVSVYSDDPQDLEGADITIELHTSGK